MKTIYESVLDIDSNTRKIVDAVYKLNHPKDKFELIDSIKYHLQNGNYDLNCIDVSKITDMNNVFFSIKLDYEEELGKIDISKWNTSRVKDMSFLFTQSSEFNSDISNWDVSNVENMYGIFAQCESFNQNLSKWNVGKVVDMRNMFFGCEKFNQDLSKWKIRKDCKTQLMFKDCKSFNQNLSNWDLSVAAKKWNTLDMFKGCPIKDEYKPKGL